MRRFRVAVVHGVNLDQLGRRDPKHYGPLTFRELERQIDEWAGEPGRIATIGAKFTKPVVVPAEGVDVVVTGLVKDDGTVAVTVTCEGVSVLGRCQATLRA